MSLKPSFVYELQLKHHFCSQGIVPASITVRVNMGVSTEGSNNISNAVYHELDATEMEDDYKLRAGLPGNSVWNPAPWQDYPSFGKEEHEELSFNTFKPAMPGKVAREGNAYSEVGRGRYYHGRGGAEEWYDERGYDGVVLDIRHHSGKRI
ncbi:hypothetical protein K435DRAFT_852593 [Dendrothele bispora CBS 962.96]|uniref:Uncharacterized protein n=1 Tax=Dendrothele bispora (strain CBS 962.96) TaxID=1314807 RepID=A0A4S8MJD8_DENBC|nr:hypothetical protein K435DRAFT_852593 [Dendrothele bispora CBS 962.96]